MKSAILIIDCSKKINVFDYAAKIKPIIDNVNNYEIIYCLLNDLSIYESTYISNDDKSKLIYDNVQTLINLGLDEKVKYILQSQMSGLFEMSNEVARNVYISKLIKNKYLKSSIQKNSLTDIKLSSLVNIANLFSSIILLNATELYETKNFEELYNYMQKVLSSHNEIERKKFILPQLVLNDSLGYGLSTDGNTFISEKFDNDLAICLTGAELQTKINAIYTDPNHIRVQDKGVVDNNPLFAFVDVICEDRDVGEFFGIDSIIDLKRHYEMGGIGDFKIKKMLYSAFLKKFNCCQKKIDVNIIKKRISGSVKNV